jgi:pterin-4a-carbinolamine dehydratase/uncharacterized protein (DUF2267 family)
VEVRTVIEAAGFLATVADRAGIGDADDAKAAVKAVLAGVAHWVDEPRREAVAAVLPRDFRHVLDAPRPIVGGDLARFLQFVSFVTDTTPDRAREDTQAVLSALRDAEPAIADDLRDHLPQEFAGLFAVPAAVRRREPEPVPAGAAALGAAPAPAAAEPAPTGEPTSSPEATEATRAPEATGAEPTQAQSAPGQSAGNAPAELTADALAGVLSELPGWRGNTRRLSRTVELPPGRGRVLLERVHAVEQELDHHATVREEPTGVTFTLWTHSLDGVTDLDVRLAGRISELIQRL